MPRYQTTPTGQRVEPGDEGYNWGQESTSFDPVAEARAYLDRETGPQQETVDVVEPTLARQRGGLRGFTEMLASPAPALGTAALGSTLTGIGAPAAPFLGAASMLSAAPNVLRQALMPEEDESRAGALGEGALYAAAPALGKFGPSIGRGIKSAVGSMRGLGNAAKPAGWVGKSVASPYGGVGRNVSNFDEAAVAADDATTGLPESWKQFATGDAPKVAQRGPRPSRARDMRTPEADISPADMLRTMGRESEAGYRNVPRSDNPLLDLLPEGGLDAITPAEWKRLGLSQVRNDIPAHLDETADWGADLLGQLTQREGRRGIPARARAFREQKSASAPPVAPSTTGLMRAGNAEVAATKVPRLARIADEGGSIQLGFHGKNVTPENITSMFPNSRVTVEPKKAFGTGRDYFKVNFWDKNDAADYQASKDAVKSLGGHLYYE